MPDKLRFVIHKHQAISLHYDLRLEVGNSMPSWAIPRGPTLDPQFKRLAMKVNDHDTEYRNFEGNIPEGSVGPGPVMIWDEGYYIPEIENPDKSRSPVKDFDKGNKTMAEGLKKGEIKFELHGKKLKGSFALVKTKGFPPGKSENAWLLIKHKDKYVILDYDAKNFDFSARTKKTLEQIASSKIN